MLAFYQRINANGAGKFVVLGTQVTIIYTVLQTFNSLSCHSINFNHSELNCFILLVPFNVFLHLSAIASFKSLHMVTLVDIFIHQLAFLHIFHLSSHLAGLRHLSSRHKKSIKYTLIQSFNV